MISLKNLGHWSASPELLSAARATLRDFENVKAVLAGLSASLEETLKEIKERIGPFELGKGLSSVPDEILSKIFEHATGGPKEHNHAVTKGNLSLVCRHFRGVVLNTPRLWSHITSFDKMPYVRACLKRGKSVGLSLVVYLNDEDELYVERALAFLATVVPHSSRWEYLYVSFDATVLGLEGRMIELLSNLRLPSLHSLILLSSSPNILGDDIRHFYQSWEMPNLRSLEVDIIPKPFVAPKLSSVQLRQFDIGEDAAESERLRNFLTTFPELEELCLELWRNGAKGYDQRDLLIDMPNLETLQIKSSFRARDVRPFMIALRAAKLRELEIIMSAEDIIDGELLFDNFLPLQQYPALETLRVRLLELSGLDQMKKLPIPFGKIPGLRTLSLDAPGFEAVAYDEFEEEDDNQIVSACAFY